ncbi:MAG: DUF362 domain-containing protein [Bryobacteraceae bacterium]|jgi:uncharacterized protein (DUF362 family)
MSVTRRSFFARAGVIAAAQGLALKAQQQQKPPVDPGATPQDPRMAAAAGDATKLFKYYDRRSKVSIIKGENRRKNIFDALVAIDDQIKPGLKTRKYVLIKPNGSDPSRQLISTQADTVHGILDYLAPRFKGPVVVAEVSGSPAKQATSQFGWDKIFAEHKSLKISFEVPNEQENAYEILDGMDYDMHLIPIRMAARIVDRDAFVISSAVMKTHNMVVATMTIKNMVLGAAMTPPPGGEKRPWAESDKRKFHVGIRAGNYNIYLGAKMMVRNWGVGIVDGFEGMEGNGPVSGTPVPSRIALASTDFLAVDRVGLECMGVDPSYPGYLNYCYQGGVGQYDLAKIDVVGAKIADVKKKYRLHADVDRMLEWRGPMLDLPPNLGRNLRPTDEELAVYA